MRKCDIQLFSEIYEYCSTSNRIDCEVNFENDSPEKKKQTIDSLSILSDSGYIAIKAKSIGFSVVRLTSKGLAFGENGYKETSSIPLSMGDNNIIVNGSENTVSDNYNKMSINLENSDLPAEYKEIIRNFLYEVKKPHMSAETKSQKIKEFLKDVSSNTLSTAASSALTFLFSNLL